MGDSLENGGVDAKFGLDEMIGLSKVLDVYPSHNIDLINFSSAISPRVANIYYNLPPPFFSQFYFLNLTFLIELLNLKFDCHRLVW